MIIPQFARAASVVAIAALTMFVPAGLAEGMDGPHPAHIHAGTCDELGDVVAPLTDVAPPEGDVSGAAPTVPVKVSETVIDMPLQEIIDGGHAINVHKSAEEIDVYIACGNVGGVVGAQEEGSGDELTIGLAELNDSGHTGIAWLGADGDKTVVSLVLLEPKESSETTESATGDAAPTESLAVEIKGFAFNPPTIEVPAGGSVTWTNQDNVPHTATGIDRAALQSGAIPFGESYTQVFATPGTYDYFCEFHANMKGTVVVS